jgi:hypothetical protein
MGGNGLYKVSSIFADVVVYSSFKPSNNGVCSGLAQVNVPVSFGLKFVPANGQAMRSGNPGYIFGKPVVVNEGGQVDKNGFKFFSDDQDGNCFATLSSVDSKSYDVTPFEFGRNLRITCDLQLTLSQLQ